MKFITLNPPSNEKEKEIWDFIKLAESKINDQEPRSYQASYVRGMMAIFNLFTHDHFMDVPKEKIKTALAHPDPGAEIMERMKKLEAVAEAANLILFWRGISETDDKKASDDWVKFLQDNGYWDRYDGCCNCSLCTKAREEYKKSVEKRLYEAVKAYREISQPDPGAEIMERMRKLEAVAEAARDYREHEYLASTDKWHEVIDRLDKSLDALEAVTPCT